MNAFEMKMLPATCHYSAWALIRRCGDTVGKRPSTRMAYLVGTIAPHGTAEAVTGYVMNNDMTGWTKSVRRIEWADIVRQWTHQPTMQQVRTVKRRMPIIRTEADRRRGQELDVYLAKQAATR